MAKNEGLCKVFATNPGDWVDNLPDKRTGTGEMLGIRGPAAQVRVSQWETGTAKIPRGKIMELAKLLEINPTDLI